MGQKYKNMRRTDIEKALRNIGERTPKIDLNSIKTAHSVRPIEGDKINKGITKAITPSLPMRRRIAYAVAAMLAIVIFAGIPVGAISYNAVNTTELYIDAEESVRLVVGPFGRVRGAELLSYDVEIDEEMAAAYQPLGTLSVSSLPSMLALSLGETAIDSIVDESVSDKLKTLKGKKIDTAVDMVINYLAENDMLPEGCEVIISTVGKNDNRAGKVALIARAAALQNKKAMLNDKTVTVLENIKEAVKNVSPAKLKFLKEALLTQTGFTNEELSGFSAGFLRYLAKASTEGNIDDPQVKRKIEKYYEIYTKRINEKKAASDKSNNSKSRQDTEG